MGGGAGDAQPDGWLRAYLESNFDDLRGRIGGLEGKVDDLAGRVSRIEGGRSEARRLGQVLRDWLSPIITALVGAWAVLGRRGP